MSQICLSKITLLSFSFCATCVCAAVEQGAHPLPAPRVLLSLPFRSTTAKDPLSKLPKRLMSIGQFQLQDEGEILFRGEMIGVDSQNLFFFDPVNPQLAMLREVTPNGQVVRQWKLPDASFLYKATVQDNRFIWLQVSEEFLTTKGFPVLIYDKRQSTTIADWRKKPPFDLTTFLRHEFGQKNLDAMGEETKKGLYEWMATVTSSAKNVFVRLENGGGGPYKTPGLDLNLTMSNSGNQLIKLEKRKTKSTDLMVQAAGRRSWSVETDFDSQTRKWKNLWVWPHGQHKGRALLTWEEMVRPNGQWQKIFPFQDSQLPPGVSVTEDGKFVLAFIDKPLVVTMSSDKKIVGFWKGTRLSPDRWVENWILPAKGGFYRQERTATHLMIYHHPLK